MGMVLGAFLLEHARVAAPSGHCSTEAANDFIGPRHDGTRELARVDDVAGARDLPRHRLA